MEFFNIFRSKSTRDLFYTFIGNSAFSGINFIIIVLIARFLGPNEFGNFSLLYATLSIIILISDFGMGVSIVKFSSEYYSKNELKKIEILLKNSFKLRLFLSLIICIIGIILYNIISVHILNNEKLMLSVIFVFIGGIGVSLFEFIKTYFQSKQSFKKYSIYINIYSFINLISILILIYFSMLTVLSAIITYSIVPFIVFGITILLINNKFLFLKNDNFNYRKFMKFNFYIIISNLCSMFFNRIDLFFLNAFLNPTAVGFYSAAFQISLLMAIFTNSITFTLLPKVSVLTNVEEIKNIYKKILKYSSILYFITIPIILIAPLIVPLVFTNLYFQSIQIFQILVLSFGMSFIINPLATILYKVNKPEILTIIIIVQLIIIIIGDPIFIILFQIYGVAYISLITHIISLIYITLYLYYYFFLKKEI